MRDVRVDCHECLFQVLTVNKQIDLSKVNFEL